MSSGELSVLPLDEKRRTLPDGRVLPEVVHSVPADDRGPVTFAADCTDQGGGSFISR